MQKIDGQRHLVPVVPPAYGYSDSDDEYSDSDDGYSDSDDEYSDSDDGYSDSDDE
jgi:hypothetical protein